MKKTCNSSEISPHAVTNSVGINVFHLLFITYNPELWFPRLQIEFELREITSTRTKFALLATEIPHEAFDLIADPKIKNDYATVISLPLKKYGSSEKERIQRFGDLFLEEAHGLSAILVTTLAWMLAKIPIQIICTLYKHATL
ncbi:unnamed protein product [Lepeophtheirus salmonis]|uniref:(salmon louse) hypothetical protein n=1 Tax=Lepeophtheirus salmonis TaxID=72036 RepID=A0A7R8CU98_LEPSM|nr:unnamed protein product [Lepeophtheirus salmonis]CAF2931561.1 unnamed protein product [Lepeophtheirus salmonis]